MTLTTSTITGRVPLPSDSAPKYAEVVFTLTKLDTEGDQVIPGGASSRFVLDANGDMPAGAALWRNTEGLRATAYRMQINWTEFHRTRGTVDRSSDAGLVQVGDDASYTIAQLINATPVPVPADTYWTSLTQEQYDAAIEAAAAAALSAAQAALHDGYRIDSVAGFGADTAMTYTAGQPGTVVAGNPVFATAEGSSLIVLASGTATYDAINANGVKLQITDRKYIGANIASKRSIVASLPLLWPAWEDAQSAYGYTPAVAQGFSYDDEGNLYLHYPSGSYSVIAIYDEGYEYQGWFAVVSGGESLVARGGPTGGNLAFYKRQGSTSSLVKIETGDWPANGADLSASHTVVIDGGVGTQFAYGDSVWVVLQSTVDLGVEASRTVWNRYDEDFNFAGSTFVNPTVVGWQLPSSQLYPYVPKSQGVAIKDQGLVFALGGFYQPSTDGPIAPEVASIGLAEVSSDGSLLQYSAAKAHKVVDLLTSLGYPTDRVESEGISRHPSGEFHGLWVNISTASGERESRGILIMREFDPYGISFGEIASAYSPIDTDRLTGGIFPRTIDGDMYHPVTNAKLATMSDVIDMMAAMQLPSVSWYTGAVYVTMLPDLSDLIGNYVVTVSNVNNALFHVSLDGTTATPWLGGYEYRVVNEGGVWRALQRSDAAFYLRLGGRATLDATTTIGRITLPHATASEEDVLLMQSTSTGSATQLILGGSSSVYNAVTAVRMYCAGDTTTTTGSMSLDVLIGSVSAGRNNEQSLGTASRLWTTVYAATGTINTSDGRRKDVDQQTMLAAPLSSAELMAAKALSKEIGTYRFLDAISIKGEAARQHVGLTVQRAIEVMEGFGLQPLDYGFICFDQWDATEAEFVVETDKDGNENRVMVSDAREAGSAYSFRHDELLLFLARGFDGRLSDLEGSLDVATSTGN